MLERLLVLRDFCSEMSGDHSELRLTEQQWEKLQKIVEVTFKNFLFLLRHSQMQLCLGPKTSSQSNRSYTMVFDIIARVFETLHSAFLVLIILK